jgi:hypothetical protein
MEGSGLKLTNKNKERVQKWRWQRVRDWAVAGCWYMQEEQYRFKLYQYWLDLKSTGLVFDKTNKAVLLVYKPFYYSSRWRMMN